MEVTINGVEYVQAPPTCADASPLETRMYVADLDATVSLREYLHQLLATLWSEGESFSGKRPFGNSGWEIDVYKFLVKSGAVSGSLDTEGDLELCDEDAAHAIMKGLIAAAMGIAS